MRIGPVFPFDKDRIKSKKKGKDGTAVTGSSFSSMLDDTVETEYSNSIEALMDDLNGQERNLLDNQTLADLQKYKKTVQKILELITRDGFETRTYRRARNANRADFFIVKEINEKLYRLAVSITSSDNKAFSLVKECEEIRGLIFDLIQ
ncbi:MAG: DUF327 family protein [Spirochaetes bacterium]|jgi:uncharacterized protein YaaR (DUF327 family)|nr:DUF327 family protein [Spirochaetota bacterium]